MLFQQSTFRATVHGNQNVSNNRENLYVPSPIRFEDEVPYLAPRKVSLNSEVGRDSDTKTETETQRRRAYL